MIWSLVTFAAIEAAATDKHRLSPFMTFSWGIPRSGIAVPSTRTNPGASFNPRTALFMALWVALKIFVSSISLASAMAIEMTKDYRCS